RFSSCSRRFLPSRARKPADARKPAWILDFGGAFYRQDRKSIDHQRAGLSPGWKLTVSFTANLSRWPAIGSDSYRDVFLLKSILYADALITGRSLQETRFHSPSTVAGGSELTS